MWIPPLPLPLTAGNGFVFHRFSRGLRSGRGVREKSPRGMTSAEHIGYRDAKIELILLVPFGSDENLMKWDRKLRVRVKDLAKLWRC